jgi:hypothetical protein
MYKTRTTHNQAVKTNTTTHSTNTIENNQHKQPTTATNESNKVGCRNHSEADADDRP